MFDEIDDMFQHQFDDVYLEFYNQLDDRTKECDVLLGEVSLNLKAQSKYLYRDKF